MKCCRRMKLRVSKEMMIYQFSQALIDDVVLYKDFVKKNFNNILSVKDLLYQLFVVSAVIKKII